MIDHSKSNPKTGVVILAAGSSSRLGKPKQLLHYRQETLIKRVVKTALQTDCNPIVVVSGFLHDEIVKELEQFPVKVVNNPDWKTGMGSSIKTGITALQQTENPDQLNAALFLLCDQPMITAEFLNLLITQFYLDKNSIITATGYSEISGVPAIFDKSIFPILSLLNNNNGAQWVFKNYPNQLLTIPFAAAAIDIDTEADYNRLLKSTQNEGK